MSQKKICFVGLDNYPVLNPDKGDELFGGESDNRRCLPKRSEILAMMSAWW